MGSVRRVYVEKKEGFALEADAVRQDLVKNLGITELTGLRILNRYDMEGVDDQTLAAARYTVSPTAVRHRLRHPARRRRGLRR